MNKDIDLLIKKIEASPFISLDSSSIFLIKNLN